MARQSGNWRDWCRDKHVELEGDVVTYWFGTVGESRQHRVRVIEREDAIAFEAVAVMPKVTTAMSESGRDPHEEAWRRNRPTQLVGFRVDGRGRLLVEAAMPKLGASEPEFRLFLSTVAKEADRLELVLTGRDEQ
jgi:hypothetical protein